MSGDAVTAPLPFPSPALRCRFRLALVVVAALVATGCDLFGSPAGPTPTDTAVRYAALGASDAIGFGSTEPCVPLIGCDEFASHGRGYVHLVARRLAQGGTPVTLTNLGIPGAVLSPETEAVGDALGRDIFDDFLEREVPFVPADTTLVTVFAGANDANTIGAAVAGGLAGADVDGYVRAQIDTFARDMTTLVARVRARAAAARLVALNLPNLAALPYAAGLPADERRRLQQIAVGFSAGINARAADGVRVVDLMCDDRVYDPSGYSGDGFHPNDAGYAILADLVFAAATTGVPAPAASCGWMTRY